jgi:hypothetical protein
MKGHTSAPPRRMTRANCFRTMLLLVPEERAPRGHQAHQ